MDFKLLFFNVFVVFAAVDSYILRHQNRLPLQRMTWRRRLTSSRPTPKPYTRNGSNGSPKSSNNNNNNNGAPSISHSLNINNLNLKPGQSKIIRHTMVISHQPVGTGDKSPKGKSNHSATSKRQPLHNPFHSNRNQGHPNQGKVHNSGNNGHATVPNGRSGSGHGNFATLRLPVVNIDRNGNILSVNAPHSHSIGVLVKGKAGAGQNRHNNNNGHVLGTNSQILGRQGFSSVGGSHGGAGHVLNSHGGMIREHGLGAVGVHAVDVVVADIYPIHSSAGVNGAHLKANNGRHGAGDMHSNVGIHTSGSLNGNIGVHVSGTVIPSMVEVVPVPTTAGGTGHSSTGKTNGQTYYEMHLSNGQRVLYAVRDNNKNTANSNVKSAGKTQGGSGSKVSTTSVYQTTEEPPEGATGPGGIDVEEMGV